MRQAQTQGTVVTTFQIGETAQATSSRDVIRITASLAVVLLQFRTQPNGCARAALTTWELDLRQLLEICKQHQLLSKQPHLTLYQLPQPSHTSFAFVLTLGASQRQFCRLSGHVELAMPPPARRKLCLPPSLPPPPDSQELERAVEV